MLSNNRFIQVFFIFLLLLALPVLVLADSSVTKWRFYPDDPLMKDNDMRDTPPVKEFDLSKSYEFIDKTFGDPVHSKGPALNTNTLGEVPDSSWFTNRIGVREMSMEEILKGPGDHNAPATGKWTVLGSSFPGITPKFKMRDSKGDTYMIKLDPVAFPELPSSVEMVSTLIFHAIGYYVPEDFIVYFKAEDLEIGAGAMVKNEDGSKRKIDAEDLKHWLKNQPLDSQGRIRAIASLWVPGKVVGQFQLTGTRSDDPNDIYPHERRRELRGLRVFAAWLNHDDMRSINSIDSYVEENGKHYIRHYLQDFGSNLGSGSTSAQQPRGGNEYLFEGDKILKGLFTFGLWTRDWMKVKYSRDASLGNIEADKFVPEKWKTEYPNPAFNEMDKGDAFWAANIVSKFNDQIIAEIVKTAELTNPEAAENLTRILIKRRDKVVGYWITRTNPLDRFAVEQNGETTQLTFDNAAIRTGAATPAGATYFTEVFSLDNATHAEKSIRARVESASMKVEIPADAWGPADPWDFRYVTVTISTNHPEYPDWSLPVRVALRLRAKTVDVVGIQRPSSFTDMNSMFRYMDATTH